MKSVCLGFVWWFLWKLLLLKNVFSMKRWYLIFFMSIVTSKIILVLKGVMYGMFGGWDQMLRICMYAFWNLKVYKRQNVAGYPIYHYSCTVQIIHRRSFTSSFSICMAVLLKYK